MAISFTTTYIQGLGGASLTGVYGKINSCTIRKYDTGQLDADGNPTNNPWYRLSYNVILHASASIRNTAGEYPEWGNRLICNHIDVYNVAVTLDQMNAADGNAYTLAYANLKTELASTDGGLDDDGNAITRTAYGTSIADA